MCKHVLTLTFSFNPPLHSQTTNRDRSSDSVFMDKENTTESAQSSPRIKPPSCLTLGPPPIPKRALEKHTKKSKTKSLSDDMRHETIFVGQMCSASFDDIGDPDDLVIFAKKSQLIDPNQSSSDSSRSQTTIDTGYISAFEMTNHHQRQFRGRFSSEDTQSSLDSYLSSDLQRADTIDSLQSNFTDSPFVLKKNVNIFNFDQSRLSKKVSSSCSIDSDNVRSSNTPVKSTTVRGGRLPPVPARKTRTPPIPPLRTSQLALHELTSSKFPLFYLLKVETFFLIFHFCNTVVCIAVKVRKSSSMAMSSQRDIKKPPPLNQIHHTKINQRQDSSISSDSYSMMSSPGYNSKTMEAPLLQHAARMKKSKNLHHGQNNSAFAMSNLSKDDAKRQESSISSESISQTSSSSGFNSKLMDTPLLAHALKLQSCEFVFTIHNKLLQDFFDLT